MDWIISNYKVEYQQALNLMESRVADIIKKKQTEAIWLLEHDDVYTAGTSASLSDLKDSKKIPVFYSNRGGKFTYHGPGQRVIYLMIKLERFNFDIRKYVSFLEQLTINTLDDFNISSHRSEKGIGVWTFEKERFGSSEPLNESKIASIGVRVRHKVAFHGIAVNISPNLKNFDGIISCGLRDIKMTSMANQGKEVTSADFDKSLKENFNSLIR